MEGTRLFNVEFVALVGLAYLLVLFVLAYVGDSHHQNENFNHNNNAVYALSLAVYCSSWTFYGAVGTATVDGFDYLAIYLGPCLVFLFGYPVMRRIILICKQNAITSVSDFISSRYGKDRNIGILVTVIAVVGSLPYIALQLKAVSSTFLVLTMQPDAPLSESGSFIAENIALITGVVLALFAILFGTRHLDTTEHHKGMILAVSFESIVKLLSILAVGYYAIYLLMNNEAYSATSPFINSTTFANAFHGNNSTLASFLTKTLLATSAIVLLPRQFQVTVVEARDHRQFKTAMWVMPVYLVLTSVIVLPIALTGSVLLPDGQADLYVLTLPLTAGNSTLAMVAFIGGVSAATGMVIVAAISLSTMVCNDLVMPFLINRKRLKILKATKLNNIILLIRRIVIVALIACAYGYYILIDRNAQLANIGLVSFAAIVQLLPAFICALLWRNANRKGVFWGLVGGFALWAYTLMLPTVLSDQVVAELFGPRTWLHPQGLFGLKMDNALTHGVVWSLLVNVFLLCWFSLRGTQSVLEKIQASRFFYIGESNVLPNKKESEDTLKVHADSLKILAEQIIGERNTRALFEQFKISTEPGVNNAQVDRHMLSTVQNAIAGVIGATSAQKMIADTLLGDDEYLEQATAFVDETSSVLQFNRNLLQTALENITHGIAVVDVNLNLVVWNDQYLKLFDYPDTLIHVGKPVQSVLQFNAERGDFGNKNHAVEINKRIKYLQNASSYSLVRKRPSGTIIKSIGEPMPGGGFVTTYEDITDSVHSSEMLRQANEELEQRVQERTKELEVLTKELEHNNRSKTHFLAAASHDLLQPINAARLFTHSISERAHEPESVVHLAENIDQSLVTANELLRALLDVSKLDSGGITPELNDFLLDEFMHVLVAEMQASANEKQVLLHYSVPDVVVRSDRQLLLSVMQNLVANGLRYSAAGGAVLVTADVDHANEKVLVSVQDRGVGIAEKYVDDIFNEFYQIKKKGNPENRGLGLGLSIVKRISRLLNLNINVTSVEGEGSTFSVSVPIGKSAVVKSVTKSMSSSANERFSGAHVLCLDNDESVLSAMQTLLQGWGCDVTPVSTFKCAVIALEAKKFDVVLADYRLDCVETGLDFLALVEKNGVLITAEQDKSLKNLSSDLGHYYLAKPVEPAALKALMLVLLNRDLCITSLFLVGNYKFVFFELNYAY